MQTKQISNRINLFLEDLHSLRWKLPRYTTLHKLHSFIRKKMKTHISQSPYLPASDLEVR